MGMMAKSVTDLHLSQLRPSAVLEALPLTRRLGRAAVRH